jgi:DNA-binding MarR family transcriptional regulator/GNAT superfamily N-acetyltransferase
MADQAVARLRSLHRLVIERAGALQTEYLGRERPLGESRLLWEIGPEGVEVRELRRRLGLDSGYVSRLLRSLESQELVAVEESGDDARVRVARLTAAGAREREELDRLSDELAGSILEPLDERQRARLSEAAGTLERLLTASLVTIAAEDPAAEAAQSCLARYYDELRERYGDRYEEGFDPTMSSLPNTEEMRPPLGLMLVARMREVPIGCGVMRLHEGSPPELKRMWVAPDARGLGLGRRLLRELEAHAAASGATAVRLETNRTLTEAIELYRSSGYVEVEPYNDERYADHWFEKRLAQAS